ncbi:hypothetical protein BDW22DRAFT_1349605 [Trametopsis cervina]|nr:hypothetical protein BDW22DRAFT_1349605 [Trametopsis cervina]
MRDEICQANPIFRCRTSRAYSLSAIQLVNNAPSLTPPPPTCSQNGAAAPVSRYGGGGTHESI